MNLSACIYEEHISGWCSERHDNGARSPGTRVTDVCDSPCGFWELNPNYLQSSKSFQPLGHCLSSFTLLFSRSLVFLWLKRKVDSNSKRTSLFLMCTLSCSLSCVHVYGFVCVYLCVYMGVCAFDTLTARRRRAIPWI